MALVISGCHHKRHTHLIQWHTVYLLSDIDTHFIMFSVKTFCLLAVLIFWLKATEADIRRGVADSTTRFNVKFLKAILQDTPGNVIVSPTNVYTLLAMLQQGSRGYSRTQLNRVLRADSFQTKLCYRSFINNIKNNPNSTLEFTNKVFIQSGFNVLTNYKEALVHYFSSGIESVDFNTTAKAADTINSWVAQSTHQRITQIVSPDSISPQTRLVLTSAVYFKNIWAEPFLNNNTINGTFSPSPGVEVNVSLMSRKGRLLAGAHSILGFKWVQIPFTKNKFSLLILLPCEEHRLDDLTSNMSERILNSIMKRSRIMDVDLRLPKFKLAYKVHTVPALKKLGLQDVFKAGISNLKAISKEPLHVSDIIHKAEIEVDEEGATASASTGAIITLSSLSLPPQNLSFHADHPFLLFIMDHENNIPLFAGRVVDPTKE